MVAALRLFAVAALAAATSASPAAVPVDSSVQSLEQRAGDGGNVALAGAQLVKEILKAIGVFTDDEKKNAWDFKSNKDMCEVFMKTVDGGKCTISVECKDGGKTEYYPNKADYKNCFVGGTETIKDPRIGEFSLTYTKRDGAEGQGLTEPVLKVKNVGNWKEWKVTDMARAKDKADLCEKGIAPLNCHRGPWLCRWVHGGNTPITQDRSKRWSCGVPKVGATFPDGTNWDKMWQH
ncbi:hypothetical protein JX265_012450 [Neoarthrinium moseri]|uniref:Uncharacterized protein n=1 Tax=Neoarthrinium moseri TaxID=1658444 RepID=A0A9P9WA79_9PEZI|nr:uncharacterized protein JN550_009921 [Neoarthrinium moseri]KAI1845455.1 hypothetical protein JX266_008313 [Neoarthrinium moseri]KAI1854416.1 hypothetical protein JX265_012450 [Neoarthrinium moseri]KAI1862774.1 hypothetical protein JN550_009921 [Neoarthrinium moseri]